jgi:hypothetical protein
MKPATAAKKLGVYLPATPPEFQDGPVTRAELNDLLANPPEWLVELRLKGPHPRQEVARKLGISVAGLQRGGAKDSMTTAEIRDLLSDQPEWLRTERKVQADVRAENARLKARDAERRATSAKAGRAGRS